MSKLNRILWTGLVLVGAACGDDVTVTPPPAPPPPETGVTAVTVAPDGANVLVTGTLQMTAAVTCTTATTDCATATVTWTSSDIAKATVSGSGLVSGVALGDVGIRATAALGTSSASGVATVHVVSSSGTPAIVSIQDFEKGGQPQNISQLFGQVDVRVNLDRGGEHVTSVQLLVDGVLVEEQAFASPPVQGSAAKSASGPEKSVEELVFSWNTADYNHQTGNALYLNGDHSVTAKVITAENASGTGSPSVKVTLVNENTAILSLVITNGSSVADAGGLTWWTGDAVATATPVIYTEAAPTIASVTFAPTGGLVGQTITTHVSGQGFVASWPKGTKFADGGSGGNGLVGVEDASFEVCVSAVVDGNPTSTLLCSDTPPSVPGTHLRYDNNGPPAPTFMANPNGRQGGWLNANVGLTAVNTGPLSDNWMVAGGVDGGVGGYVLELRSGPAGAGLTVDGALTAGPPQHTPVLGNPSLTNITYCAVASATDLLGNESFLPVAGDPCTNPTGLPTFTPVLAQSLLYGVDTQAPVIAFTPAAGLAANARVNTATVAAEFSFQASDVGAVGVSGLAATTAGGIGPVMATINVFNATGTSCFFGLTSACLERSIDLLPGPQVPPTVTTETVAASSTTGYYTITAASRDAAGNESAPITRSIAYDASTNPPALTSALFNTPLSGPNAVFVANSSDNFDLWKVSYALSYPGLPGPLGQPAVILNTFPPVPGTLVNSNVPAGITINGFMRQLEIVSGNSPLAAGAPVKPSQLDGTITDQAGNVTGPVTTVIGPASVTAGVSFLGVADPGKQTDSWSITNAATNISNGAGPAAAVNPLSVTITADAVGPNNTYDAPFARVDFYMFDGANLVLIGSSTSALTTDPITTCPVGFCRQHRYSFTWTPGAAQPVGAATLYAFGVSAAGDGLVTLANTNITITNP